MTWPVSNPIARELDDFWKESQSLWQQWWYEADLDTKMYTGQQDYWNTFYNINYRNQKILMFNKIMREINMISGYQIDNRLATIVIPADSDPDSGVVADERTAVLSWMKRQDHTYERISDCFKGAAVCGLNLQHVWMDFREDPENGSVKTERIPFSAFLMDNYWTKPDLSDCDRIWTRKYVTKRQLKSLFPKIEKDLPSLGKGYAAKDGKFQFLAQNWCQYQQEMYAYDEYWTKDWKPIRKLLDTQTGELIVWKGTKEQFQALRAINPNVEIIKATIPTIKWHVLVNGHVVYEEKSPWGLDRLPFVPYVFYHNTEVQNYAYRYFGAVRNIRDPQIEKNRRINRMLDIMDAQIQSGLMVKEDALVNPEDAFFQGPGKVLYFKQTANLATDVVPMPAPPVPAGWMELSKSLDQEMMDIVGTPQELFGKDGSSKDMSGVLFQLKQGAGLVSLRNVFDSLSESQRAVGEIMLEFAMKNFGQAKLTKILGKAPSPVFSDIENFTYSCATEEGVLTTTQRQLQFMQAMTLKQMGIPISNRHMLEISTLQGKKAIIDEMMQMEQQAKQMQQAQAQAQIEQTQMLSHSLAAKAEKDKADAKERLTRAVADIGLAKERAAMAAHDRAATALDNAKALNELQEMDENRLMKLSKFILELQVAQRDLAGDEEEDSTEIAEDLGEEIDVGESAHESRSISGGSRQAAQSGGIPPLGES